MKLGRYVIIGIVLGLGIGDYLHITHQIIADRDSASIKTPSPISTASASPTPTPTETPLAQGQSYVKIPLYGLKLVVSDPIPDLVYGEVKYNGQTVIGFTTESLLAKYPSCTAGSLGYLMQSKAHTTSSPSPTPTPSTSYYHAPRTTLYNQSFTKTVGGYAYTYRNNYSGCATDSSGQNSVTQDKAFLISGALPTLSLSPATTSPSPSPSSKP